MTAVPVGSPRTIIVNPSGAPTNSLSFPLPPGVSIDVESVLAAVDATGAADTIATLTIADSSGAVIARKAQGKPVTGGVVGSATWALRLDDEEPVAPPPPDPFLPVYSVYATRAGGQSIAPLALVPVVFSSVKYDNGGWINLATDPTLFTVPASGYYTVWMQFEWQPATATGKVRQGSIAVTGDPWHNGEVARDQRYTLNGWPTSYGVSLTRRLAAGEKIHAIAFHNEAGNFTLGSCDFAVTRVWKA